MRVTALLLLTASLLAPSPASAQEGATVTAEEAVTAAEEAYGPPDARAKPACPAPKPGGEIVVCGQTEDSSKYRVKSSADLDPKAAKDIVPRAPDLYNLPQPAMLGVGITMGGCFIPPCPAPMPLLIDLKAIPDAPPGSDADRVGRGLAPRGGPDPVPALPMMPSSPPSASGPAVKPPE
jgi:hypothetical protein